MRDFDIRLLLKNTELQKFNDGSSVVVEELDVSCTGARIDVAVINGSLHAYEIKSAQDTLVRLPSQIQSYKKVFDFISVVTEEKHVNKVKKVIPDFIGLYVCNKQGEITVKRKPKKNIETEAFYLAKLLWKEELISVLNAFNIKHSKSQRNWLLCEILASNLAKDKLSLVVRETLKSRENWKLTSKAGLRFFRNDDCG